MLKKDVVKVREILMNEVDCKFTVKGITEYGRKKDGEYGKVAKVFRTSSPNKDGKRIYTHYLKMSDFLSIEEIRNYPVGGNQQFDPTSYL